MNSYSIDVDRPSGPRWVNQSSHRAWLIDEASRLLDFYQAASINPEGGFFDLDDRGTPLPTGWPPASAPTRNLFQTTRIVHCFSLGHLLGRPGSSQLVDHGMRFLLNGHRDTEHGGYFWSNGYRSPLDTTKNAYGHAFVLLAASSAKAAGHPDADTLLADISGILDTHFWDEEFGAIREDFHRDWTPVETYRGQNSNMHLTEALMAAFEVTGDTLYLTRAERIATLLIKTATANNNWRLPEHYDERWAIDYEYGRDVFRPYGSTIGHWLEWSRLLLQLWSLKGRSDDWMKAAAIKLFDKSVTEGWSPENGGFYFTVGWDGKPVDKDRYWWPCTEGIGAAAFLADITGEARFEGWYRRIWDWCEQHLIDRQNGSWHHQLNDDLKPTNDPWYGKPDLYHSLQATLIPLLPTSGSVAHGLLHSGLKL
ncbi:AGE family epimerase/isomerase [Nitratireductor sp. GCM10026969]|uniref:AGE family epimerase/isomerase n=1 Tax=Nitratireductor sp. GCM10026969 TaxID=3252645 RepID=UPI00360ABE28